MIQQLTPPTGKVRMVLDTDTCNEVDDQFALGYALLSSEKLSVDAVYAAPFSSWEFFSRMLDAGSALPPMTEDLRTGLDLSCKAIQNIYELLGQSFEGKVFKGSERYMTETGKPVESAAAYDLVRRAMASDETLYVLAIGEITNIASAIIMEPAILNKIVVVWLAGQPLYWPQTIEFNLCQDMVASQLMFDCGVPLVLVPCMSVASHLSTTVAELNEKINGRSRIGTYLFNIVSAQMNEEAAANTLKALRSSYLKRVDDYDPKLLDSLPVRPMACSRVIWDIAAIGYMVNPGWCPSRLISAPKLVSDFVWETDPTRHLMRICNYIYRDGVFGDMFKKLSEADQRRGEA